MRILLIEDDQVLAELLRKSLTTQHYQVDQADNGRMGWEFAASISYDLILLDVILPKLDGITLCRQLRESHNQTPIILMTTQDDHSDKVMGLDAGADDYLIKPFNIEELLARVRALLRRGSLSSSPVLRWGDLSLDPCSCQVTYQDQPLILTAKEYEIVELFLRSPQRIFSQSLILDHLWSYDDPPSENAVRAHIKSLRQKLKKIGVMDLIETVYGLGYRLKHLQGSSSNSLMIESENSNSPLTENQSLQHSQDLLKQGLLKIWDKYKDQYQTRIEIITEAVIALSQNNLSQDLKEKAIREAHTLAGSLGTFGLPESSQISRQIEKIFKNEDLLKTTPPQYLLDRLKTLQEKLKKNTVISTETSSVVEIKYQYCVLMIDEDMELFTALKDSAKFWKIEVIMVDNITNLSQQICEYQPQVILLNLGHNHHTDQSDQSFINGLDLLAELTQQYPQLPIITFTGQEEFFARIKAVRMGVKYLLQKPITPERVIHTIHQVLQQSNPTHSKLLIVDDDPQILEFLEETLKPWGFEVDLLSDPKKFWEILEESHPDLLILDIEMPDYNGIELCQVVRSDPDWSDLPILFLSTHTDPQTIERVFTVGADDYIHKPIVCAELIARVSNRLQRTKILRKLADIDSLTGVSNRRKSTQDIMQLLNLAQRENVPLCFAILDLDFFKKINDQYGHEIGDNVLMRFGELLRQTFRKNDIIARWGGEEFVLGLYRMTREDGLERLRDFLDLIHEQIFRDNQGNLFKITFSAGVAEYPHDGIDLKSLYHAADTALYEAKSTGRARVLDANFVKTTSLHS